MSGEILMFVGNQLVKSREILMFVCLQKDAKQCCDATKFDSTHCAGQRRQSLTSTMSTIKLCCITALFGIFLGTNKHQNLAMLTTWLQANIIISQDIQPGYKQTSRPPIDLCTSLYPALGTPGPRMLIGAGHVFHLCLPLCMKVTSLCVMLGNWH